MAGMPPAVPPRGRKVSRNSQNSENMPNYYHPCVGDLDQVKQLMVQYVGKEGAFIIRNSFSRQGSYTASVMHGEGIKHFNIVKNGAFFLVQEQSFGTIEEVVEYFSRNDVPNQEGVKHVRLRYPIPCNCLKNTGSPFMPSTPQSSRSDMSFSPWDQASGTSASGSVTLPANYRMEPDAMSASSVDSMERMRPTSDIVHVPTVRKERGPKAVLKNLLRPKTVIHRNAGLKHRRHGNNHTIDASIRDRPPQPLPASAQTQISKTPLEYEEVRNTEINRIPELIANLRMTAEQSEKCECGLTLDESELPNNWSMHISHDEKTKGRLFFMGPLGGQTSWNLPLEVALLLAPEDQDRISAVKQKCEDIQERHRQAKLAKFNAGAQNENFQSNQFNANGFTSTAEGAASGSGDSFSLNSAPQFNNNGEGGGVGGMVGGGGNNPVQHNVYTGSTTGDSPAMSAVGLSLQTSS